MGRDEVELRRSRSPRRRPMPGPGYVRPYGLGQPPIGPLESWAHLDPTGFAPRIVRLTRLVPGVSTIEQRFVAPLEARVLAIVVARARLVLPPTVPEPSPRIVPDEVVATAGDELADSTLARLVSDELLILGALAGGAPVPLVHVTASRRGDRVAVLSNVTAVGRDAGALRPDRTAVYVANLVHLGLARIGPADEGLREGYYRLLAERAVTTARAEAAAGRRMRKARIERRTLRITDFGHELWQAHRVRGAGRPGGTVEW